MKCTKWYGDCSLVYVEGTLRSRFLAAGLALGFDGVMMGWRGLMGVMGLMGGLGLIGPVRRYAG